MIIVIQKYKNVFYQWEKRSLICYDNGIKMIMFHTNSFDMQCKLNKSSFYIFWTNNNCFSIVLNCWTFLSKYFVKIIFLCKKVAYTLITLSVNSPILFSKLFMHILKYAWWLENDFICMFYHMIWRKIYALKLAYIKLRSYECKNVRPFIFFNYISF